MYIRIEALGGNSRGIATSGLLMHIAYRCLDVATTPTPTFFTYEVKVCADGVMKLNEMEVWALPTPLGGERDH